MGDGPINTSRSDPDYIMDVISDVREHSRTSLCLREDAFPSVSFAPLDVESMLQANTESVDLTLKFAKEWSTYTNTIVSWIQQKLILELEYNTNLGKLADTMKGKMETNCSMPLHAMFKTTLLNNVENSHGLHQANLSLPSDKLVQPLLDTTNELKRRMKTLKKLWKKVQKKTGESEAHVKKAKLLCVKREQQYEKAKSALICAQQEAAQGSSGCCGLKSVTKQVNRKQRAEEEALRKLERAKELYQVSVTNVKARQNDLENAKKEILTELEQTIYRCDATLQAVLINLLAMQQQQAESLSDQMRSCICNVNKYHPGREYIDFVTANLVKKEFTRDVINQSTNSPSPSGCKITDFSGGHFADRCHVGKKSCPNAAGDFQQQLACPPAKSTASSAEDLEGVDVPPAESDLQLKSASLNVGNTCNKSRELLLPFHQNRESIRRRSRNMAKVFLELVRMQLESDSLGLRLQITFINFMPLQEVQETGAVTSQELLDGNIIKHVVNNSEASEHMSLDSLNTTNRDFEHSPNNLALVPLGTFGKDSMPKIVVSRDLCSDEFSLIHETEHQKEIVEQDLEESTQTSDGQKKSDSQTYRSYCPLTSDEFVNLYFETLDYPNSSCEQLKCSDPEMITAGVVTEDQSVNESSSEETESTDENFMSVPALSHRFVELRLPKLCHQCSRLAFKGVQCQKCHCVSHRRCLENITVLCDQQDVDFISEGLDAEFSHYPTPENMCKSFNSTLPSHRKAVGAERRRVIQNK